MPLKIFITLTAFILLAFPVMAKEKSVQAQHDFSLGCPAEDTLCTGLTTAPKAGPKLEILKFERVIDGDTIIASNRKIRIWGIDTPEKDQPGYLAASWLLESLIKEGELSCKLIDMDKYKREVMHCLIDGLDIGSMMVKSGMARDYTKYSGGYYKQEQDKAKSEKRGIWKSVPAK